MPALWYFDSSVIYHNDFVESYTSNISEIFLYNRQKVEITYELTFVIRAARR